MEFKLLLVDDEQSVLNSLERLLRPEGYKIFKAQSGKEGLDILKENMDIALIISDQRMPEMNGAEFLSKAKETNPECIRIALTGQTDIDMMLQTINEGHVSKFLLKPWSNDQLKETIRNSLTIYKIKNENKLLQKEVSKKNMQLEEINRNLEKKVYERTVELEDSRNMIKRSLNDMSTVLAELMEFYSPGLKGHARRVAVGARKLAQKAELPGSQIELIFQAALLHDIGKITISKDILKTKYDKLSSSQKTSFQQHPVIGYNILNQIKGFEEISEIVKCHHETVDSRGYPSRLSSEKIPLGAKIIAIVNNYDNLIYPNWSVVIGSQSEAIQQLDIMSQNVLDEALTLLFTESVLPDMQSQDNTVEVDITSIKPGMVLAKDVLNVNSVQLLRKGITFTDELIMKLIRNTKTDPILSRVFIKQDSLPHKPENEIKSTDNKKLKTNVIQKIDNTSKSASIDVKKKSMISEHENHKEYRKKVENRKPLVVVLDDQKEIVNALKRELHSAGYRVAGYTDSFYALQYLKDVKDKCYALITDYSMPDILGDKFINILQKSCPSIPCIVLTGNATKENVVKMLKSGKIARIMTKPWNKSELLDTLSGINS